LVQACVLAKPDFVRPGSACARIGVRCAPCDAAPGELDMLLQLQPYPADTARRGIVLLVVIAMLTLFAAVALSFVFYADTEAANSRTGRDALIRAQPDMDPEGALAFILSKLLFGEEDNEPGVYSAVRGHDLARSMYGYNPGSIPVAWNGTGRLHSRVSMVL